MIEESFERDPTEIAGLGNLLDRIGIGTLASHRYLLDNANLSENVGTLGRADHVGRAC